WEAIEELGEINTEAVDIVGAAAGVEPRFESYRARLTAALSRLREGDERFFTGVTVDSFHTVWFECHEDLIQTLGRERIAEGSF
ncbi:MAG: transcriptional regulator, partial [Actinomycetota bacterium]